MRVAIFVIVVIGLVAGAAAYNAYVFYTIGPVEMNGHGIAAMVLGVVLTLALGMGLMGLIFYSARKGYDDRVVNTVPLDEEDDTRVG